MTPSINGKRKFSGLFDENSAITSSAV